jgi:hypothetical protein
LRPESVLFIDDNPMNLNEARYFVPNLQVAEPSAISGMLADPRFKGKNDPALSRLGQYKLLEQRKADEVAAGGNNIEFLRSSNIRIYIEHDIETHIDRAIELINRTNQLNFTKRRLADDIEAAREEFAKLLHRPFVQAGLVRVIDNYGDYGFCGFYATETYVDRKALIHYCFSCRALGMGVESYLYQLLGRPDLTVRGEVLSNPIEDPEVDWISVTEPTRPDHVAVPHLPSSIYLRGGCDLMVVEHYARMVSPRVFGEYNIERNGLAVRLDHTLLTRYAIEGLPTNAAAAFAVLGYQPDDLKSEIPSMRSPATLVLSYTPDFWVPVYRHRQTGALIPFPFLGVKGVRNPTEIPRPQREQLIKNPNLLNAVDVLEREFTYLGLIGESDFKSNLRVILNAVPRDSQIILILHREFYGDGTVPEVAAPPIMNVNRWTTEVADEYDNVETVPITQFIQSPDDMIDGIAHYNRMVYFRLFNYIKDIATHGTSSNNRLIRRSARDRVHA